MIISNGCVHYCTLTTLLVTAQAQLCTLRRPNPCQHVVQHSSEISLEHAIIASCVEQALTVAVIQHTGLNAHAQHTVVLTTYLPRAELL
jgi:hypothetical protein